MVIEVSRDRGLIGIDPNYHVHVSRQIKELFNNGKRYYELAETELKYLPAHEQNRPSPENLEWHMKHVFKGN